MWTTYKSNGALFLQGAISYLKGGGFVRTFTGMSGRRPYSSFQADFNAKGALTGKKYFYTGITGHPYSAYEIDKAPNHAKLDIIFDNKNGSHTTEAVAANVKLSGFSGKDIFEFKANPADVGHDVIKGFDTAKDVIDISHKVFADYKALVAAIKSDPLDGPGATSTQIRLDAHDWLQIAGVAPGDLSKANFAFV